MAENTSIELLEENVGDRLECTICESVVKYVEETVKDSFIIQLVESALRQACHFLMLFSNMCERFVHTFFTELAALISAGLSRIHICKLIGVCSIPPLDHESVGHQLEFQIISYESDTSRSSEDHTVTEDTSYETAEKTSIELNEKNVEIGECLVCKAVVEAVKQIVKHSFHRGDVEKALRKACHKVHSNKCDRFVNNHFAQLADLLSKASTRGRVCNIIRICAILPLDEQFVDSLPEFQIIDNLSDKSLSSADPTITKGKYNCVICKGVVEVAKHLIKNDHSKNKIADSLRKACGHLHKFGPKCNNFVNDYFNQLLDNLLNAATRNRVCSIIKLCAINPQDINENHTSLGVQSDAPNEAEEKTSIEFIEENVGIGECLVCKAVVEVVKQIVKHSFHRGDVEKALRKACHKVHSNKCEHFVNNHFAQLADLLSKASTRGRVCNIIRICAILPLDDQFVDSFPGFQIIDNLSDKPLSSEDHTITKGKYNCVICKGVVEVAKHLIKNDHSKNKIADSLRKACGHLHKFGPKCNNFVNDYFNQLLDNLLNAATRNRVCSIIKLCAINPQEINENHTSLGVQSDAPNQAEEKTSIELIEENVGIGECLVCKAVVEVVKQIVKHSFHRGDVEKALRKACHKVHSNKCEHFVNNHFAQLADLLSKASTRGRVCNIIRICAILPLDDQFVDSFPGFQIIDNLSDKSLSSEDHTITKGKYNCVICKGVVEVAKHLIKNDHSKNKIADSLRKACGHLHKFGPKCNNFVNDYFNQLLDNLLNAATRNRVCSIIKLCAINPQEINENHTSPGVQSDAPNEAEEKTSIELIEENVGIGECLVCKAVVEVVKQIVKHSFHRGDVEKALRKACHKVHSNKCEHFVNNHFAQLADLLSKASTRGRVCNIIRICAIPDWLNDELGSDLEFQINHGSDALLSAGDDTNTKGEYNCAICENFVEVYEHLIENDYSKNKIADSLRKVCGDLLESGSECNTFVNEYFNQLVDVLPNAATRGDVCRMLKLCAIEPHVEVNPEKYENNYL